MSIGVPIRDKSPMGTSTSRGRCLNIHLRPMTQTSTAGQYFYQGFEIIHVNNASYSLYSRIGERIKHKDCRSGSLSSSVSYYGIDCR